MSVSKIICNIKTFIQYFTSKDSILKSSLVQIQQSVCTVCEQLAALPMISNAQLPIKLVEKHECLKQRVLFCVSGLIDEEISELKRVLMHLEDIVETLNKMYGKIEQDMLQVNWEEISSFRMSVLLELIWWIEKCSKFFYLVYFNISNAITMFHMDSTRSCRWFKDICNFSNESDVIFNHPVLNILSLLEKEILNS